MNIAAKTILRWIAVLPAAIACYIVASSLLGFVNLVIGFLYVEEAWSKNGLMLIQSIFAPAAYIWYGSRVAPNHRFVTALVLAAIHLCVLVVVATLIIQTGNWQNWKAVWMGFILIVCITSTIVTSVSVYNEDGLN